MSAEQQEKPERREPQEPQEPLAFVKHTKRGDKAYAVPAAPAPLFDTHGHLTCFWSKDPAEVLVRAGRAGVRRLVTLFDPIADEMPLEEFRHRLAEWRARATAQAAEAGMPARGLPDVSYLAGVHPYGAPVFSDGALSVVEQALADPRCAGVGEIGLDYHFDADDNIEAAPHDVQIACFERQLALACSRNVPVELHVRNDGADEARAAHADAYRVLSEVGIPAAGCVLHCFTEDRATMERFVELGCHIAFGGAATFKRNADIREAFAACPLDRILFETDCPYMAPEPLRGIECEPALIAFTATALAQDRSERTGEDPADIMRAAWENATALFAG